MTLKEYYGCAVDVRSDALAKCCGSSGWIAKMLSMSPAHNIKDLLHQATTAWGQCGKEDWLEAFAHHPKIGDADALKRKFATTAQWAAGEQSGVNAASPETITALVIGNRQYEDKFGFIFIVCATGKTAHEMLELLLVRLPNTREEELRIAAQEQMKITIIRLKKLITE
jgi:2-oxo-4-hydroxy-4-carboxy-5-ureidoimidazoline decarboxylase